MEAVKRLQELGACMNAAHYEVEDFDNSAAATYRLAETVAYAAAEIVAALSAIEMSLRNGRST